MSLGYIPPEGYPSWVKVPPVDPATLTPTSTATPGGNARDWTTGVVDPGDVIMFPNGSYPSEPGWRVDGGTEAEPVTVFAENSRQAIVHRTIEEWRLGGYFTEGPEGGHYIRIIGMVYDNMDLCLYTLQSDTALHHITFQNCVFKNGNRVDVDNASVRIGNGSNIIFSNCLFDNSYGGLQIGKKDSTGVANILIEGCTSIDTNGSPQDGFALENKVLTTGVLIRDCVSSGHSDAAFDIKPLSELLRCTGSDSGIGLKLWRGGTVDDSVFSGSVYSLDLVGLKPTTVGDRVFTDCDMTGTIRATTSYAGSEVPYLRFIDCTLGGVDLTSTSQMTTDVDQEPRILFGAAPSSSVGKLVYSPHSAHARHR